MNRETTLISWVCVGFALVMLAMLVASASCSRIPTERERVPDNDKNLSETSVERIVDREFGVVCYRTLYVGYGVAISCVAYEEGGQ